MQKLWPVEVCCQNLCRGRKICQKCAAAEPCGALFRPLIRMLFYQSGERKTDSFSSRVQEDSFFFLSLDRNRLGLDRDHTEGGGNRREINTLVYLETTEGGDGGIGGWRKCMVAMISRLLQAAICDCDVTSMTRTRNSKDSRH